MYIPGPNGVDDQRTVVGLLRAGRVGHLIDHAADGFNGSMLPFLVDDNLRSIRVHLARGNPQWRALDGQPVMFLVQVSSAYVSPNWYPSKVTDSRVVPTWNYEVVHVHGVARIRDDPAFVAAVVRELTDRNERERAERDGGQMWSVDDAPTEFIERQLRAIVGVEIDVARVEAKRKLSQNRTADDHDGVARGLAESGRAGDREVSRSMFHDG
ncbi:MAG: FMN-binding negative transcriptional regulator [Ilumatobacteraceae bacterium]